MPVISPEDSKNAALSHKNTAQVLNTKAPLPKSPERPAIPFYCISNLSDVDTPARLEDTVVSGDARPTSA